MKRLIPITAAALLFANPSHAHLTGNSLTKVWSMGMLAGQVRSLCVNQRMGLLKPHQMEIAFKASRRRWVSDYGNTFSIATMDKAVMGVLKDAEERRGIPLQNRDQCIAVWSKAMSE